MHRFQKSPRWQSIFCAVFAATCIVFLLQTNLLAQENPESKKIDQWLTHLEKNNQFMGSVTVLKDGETIHSKAYGFIHVDGENKIPANSKTKYRIGSITKTFTSVMILQLVEEGKLSLDDKLAKYFPDVKASDAITVDLLLQHRSGLGSITSDPTYLDWSTAEKSREQMMGKILAMPTAFSPNEKTEYSNTNFLLLGYIIEDITGKSYADELASRITQPLELNDTYFGKKIVSTENEAASFKFDGQQWALEPETDMSIPHGAGSIVSTTDDLAKFQTALFSEKLVSSESLSLMKEIKEGMGRGLFQFPFGSKKAFGHNGGIDGFQSNLAIFPDDNVVVALCGNGFVYDMNSVLIGVLSRTFDVPHEMPSFETVEVDIESLNQFEGVYSTKKFPLKITIAVDNGQLTGQATGQGAFPLTATSETEFRFDAAQISMEFTKSKKDGDFDGFKFSQGGQKLKFKKEK
jgi:D-alanyl-D-alanine carboxypeptidase